MTCGAIFFFIAFGGTVLGFLMGVLLCSHIMINRERH
jgi:hypothetical protein